MRWRNKRSARWPAGGTPEEIRSRQAGRLRHYLRQTVLPFSEYYGRLFREHGLSADSIRSLEDWERVPFTSKLDLLNTPENPTKTLEFVLKPDRRQLARRPETILRACIQGKDAVRKRLEAEFRPIFMTSTTGRSAESIPFVFTRHDLDNLAIAGARLMDLCESTSEDRLLNLFPFAPHLAFWQVHYAAERSGVFCLATGGGRGLGTEKTLRLIERLKPAALIGMPTYIYHTLHEAVEAGIRCTSLTQIVLGGEKAPPGIRRKLRALAAELGSTQVSVQVTYGFTEAKMAWVECACADGASSQGYHLYPDLGFFEVIDPESGAVLPPGEPGELVYTPLDSRGTVVLRYRTGDIIEKGQVFEPCPSCGRCVPRLVGNISRRSEIRELRLEKVKGTLIDFNRLETLLDDLPNIGAWQIELRKRHDDPLDVDEMVIHAHKLNGVDDDQLSEELVRRFHLELEVRPNRIIFHSAAEMQQLHGVGKNLKEEKVVDRRPAAMAAGSEPIPDHPPKARQKTKAVP